MVYEEVEDIVQEIKRQVNNKSHVKLILKKNGNTLFVQGEPIIVLSILLDYGMNFTSCDYVII